jgi:hypothetical protein
VLTRTKKSDTPRAVVREYHPRVGPGGPATGGGAEMRSKSRAIKAVAFAAVFAIQLLGVPVLASQPPLAHAGPQPGVTTAEPHMASVAAAGHAARPTTPEAANKSHPAPPRGLPEHAPTGQGTTLSAQLPIPAAGPKGATASSGGALGATSNVERLNEFEGIDDTGFVPPDTQFAAGPSDVIEEVNTSGLIFDRNGNVISSQFSLDTLYGSNTSGTDPRVLYDPVSGRYFASYELRSAGGDTVAVAATRDNTAWNWCYVYVAQNTNGTLFDQPKLGFSADKVVVSWNNYTNGGNTFTGSQNSVVQKSDLMNCTTVHITNSAQDNTRFGIQPAASITSTTTQWMTYHNIGSGSIGAVSVTGTPTAGNVAYNYFTYNFGTITEPPPAHQPAGGDATIETNDSRMLSAVFRSGILWGTFHMGCSPPGEGLHVCADFFTLNTANTSTSTLWNTYLNSNFDEYYPSVALTINGDLYFGVTISSPAQNPSAAVYMTPGAGFGSISGVYIQTGFEPYACGCDRWGDYSGTVLDPVDPNDAWAAQEYGGTNGCAGCWGTAIARVTRYTPNLTSVSPSSYVANSTCTPTVTLNGQDFGRSDSVVHIGGATAFPSWNSTNQLQFSLPPQGPQSTSVYVSDGIGNSNSLGFTYTLDTTAPTSSASVSPGPNGSGWITSQPTVTISSSDQSCGTGMSQLQYYTTGAQSSGTVTVSGGPGTITTSVSITAQGVTTVNYRGIDRAGATEAWKSIVVRYDSTGPSASINGLPIQLLLAPGAPLTGTATDNASGVSSVSVSFTGVLGGGTRAATCTSGCGTNAASWSVSTSGLLGVYIVTATATDVAGNTGLPSAPVILVVI